jgi:hypothetical protein
MAIKTWKYNLLKKRLVMLRRLTRLTEEQEKFSYDHGVTFLARFEVESTAKPEDSVYNPQC